jgi:hypothetical protein
MPNVTATSAGSKSFTNRDGKPMYHRIHGKKSHGFKGWRVRVEGHQAAAGGV